MPFHSFGFIFVFVPLVVTGYAAFGRASADAAQYWLIFSSLVFFCWSEPWVLPVLIGSILFNYWISSGLNSNDARSEQRLKLALAANIAILVVFKYTGFAFGNLNAAFGTHLTYPRLLLPMGISFFTVQQIITAQPPPSQPPGR